MQSMKFIGWVEKILDPDQYNREFVVRDFKNDEDPDKPKFPIALTFRASVKNGAALQLDSVNEGDKVQVEFFIRGNTGVSRAGKYYHINELRIAKENGVVVLEKCGHATVREDEPQNDGSEDLPF